MGEWIDETWRWKLRWRRRLLTWEQNQEAQLQHIVQNVQLRKETEDIWWWRHEKDGKYTVNSAYKLLTATEDGDEQAYLKRCWNPTIPLKICAFNWLSMLGRIPCKENLMKRNIIKQEVAARCSFCEAIIENENHMLLWCDFSVQVWNKNSAWWDITQVRPRICKEAFIQHGWAGRNQNGWQVVWFATIWSLWLARNRKVFQDKQVVVDEVFEMVRHNSYYWIKSSIEGWSYSYTDWCCNPSRCRIINFQN